jgi:hypothetical protein
MRSKESGMEGTDGGEKEELASHVVVQEIRT